MDFVTELYLYFGLSIKYQVLPSGFSPDNPMPLAMEMGIISPAQFGA